MAWPVHKGVVSPRLPGQSYILGSAVLRTVPGHYGLAASTSGDIWSVRSGRWRKLSQYLGGAHGNKYMRVTVRVEGAPRPQYVHKLVAAAWCDTPPDMDTEVYEVDHKDTDRYNNKPDNLQYLEAGRHRAKSVARESASSEMREQDWREIL